MEVATYSPTLDAHLTKPAPARLYHYTSAAGLLGITQTKELWATNLEHVNDSKEVGYAVELVRRTADHFARYGTYTPDELLFLKALAGSAASATVRTYAFSLSEDPNRLSQWRAYCPPGAGYALGFASSHLGRIAADQDFLLCACVYDHGVQDRVVREMISHFVKEYQAARPSDGDLRQYTARVAHACGQHVAQFGAILKHPDFREECEWRLLSRPLSDPDPRTCFRSGPHGLVPFTKIRLRTVATPSFTGDGDRADEINVMLGPTHDVRRAVGALSTYLRHCDMTSSISQSNTPYLR